MCNTSHVNTIETCLGIFAYYCTNPWMQVYIYIRNSILREQKNIYINMSVELRGLFILMSYFLLLLLLLLSTLLNNKSKNTNIFHDKET